MALAAEHREVQRLGLGARVGAELLDKDGPQPLVGGERLTRLAEAVVSGDHRAVGLLVERVGGDRLLGEGDRPAMLAYSRPGPPPRHPAPPHQPLELPSDLFSHSPPAVSSSSGMPAPSI